jgi:hypothetical protein
MRLGAPAAIAARVDSAGPKRVVPPETLLSNSGDRESNSGSGLEIMARDINILLGQLQSANPMDLQFWRHRN